MVLMALDHARDYWAPTPFDPTDVAETTPAWFFVRWVTHLCAPAFVFLAGTAAFYKGRRVGTAGLSRWLVVRGLWLVLLEVAVNNTIWWVGVWPTFGFLLSLQVLWAIGVSMVCLGGLCRLPPRVVLAIALVVIAGHNLLDGLSSTAAGSSSAPALLWSLVHVQRVVPMPPGAEAPSWTLLVLYPLLPWVGVMAAGWVFGGWFESRTERSGPVLALGLALTAAFVVLRLANAYGDPSPWATSGRGGLYTLLDVLACTKYPPSLLFLLMTLGPALVLLAWFERLPAGAIRWLTVYGRAPLFFYLAHMVAIHGLMLVAAAAAERPASWWFSVALGDELEGYTPALSPALHIWAVVCFALYPACYAWGLFKQQKRHRWADFL